MATRAKFTCYEITDHNYKAVKTQDVLLRPVGGDTAENKLFFASTPSGEIKLTNLKPEVAAQFESGATYYVDFTEAE